MGNEKGNPAKSSHTEHAEHIVSWEEQVEKKKASSKGDLVKRPDSDSEQVHSTYTLKSY